MWLVGCATVLIACWVVRVDACSLSQCFILLCEKHVVFTTIRAHLRVCVCSGVQNFRITCAQEIFFRTDAAAGCEWFAVGDSVCACKAAKLSPTAVR